MDLQPAAGPGILSGLHRALFEQAAGIEQQATSCRHRQLASLAGGQPRAAAQGHQADRPALLGQQQAAAGAVHPSGGAVEGEGAARVLLHFQAHRAAPQLQASLGAVEQRSRLAPRVQAQAAAVGQQPVAALAGAGRQFAGQTHAGLDPALQAGAAGEQDEQPEGAADEAPAARRLLQGAQHGSARLAAPGRVL
ncbi:hypothetical protein P4105_26670 [Pseudomonas aeruginosa]|nr:hypothetical protein [Pseudomonas aeruginosa]